MLVSEKATATNQRSVEACAEEHDTHTGASVAHEANELTQLSLSHAVRLQQHKILKRAYTVKKSNNSRVTFE